MTTASTQSAYHGDLLPDLFLCHGYDARSILPAGWQDGILRVARERAQLHVLVPTSVTSREASTDLRIPTWTVGGLAIAEHLPWVWEFYRGPVRELAQRLYPNERVLTTDQPYGVNFNVQYGDPARNEHGVYERDGEQGRYEVHLDSNGLQANLYATEGDDGELVVSNEDSMDVWGVEAVEKNATVLRPRLAQLLMFDARRHSHYVRALKARDAIRVSLVMNLYLENTGPESARPADLSDHLARV